MNPPKLLIIGSRTPTQEGKEIAYEIAKLSASKGYSIISGCAPGIDASAHLGALENSGSTIAILPSGLNTISYPETQELQHQIELSGLCISEYESEQQSNDVTKIDRDRIQAALAHIVIVVETEIEGGAMETVDFAKEMKKKIYVVKFGKPHKVRRGNSRLLKEKIILPLGTDDLDSALEYILK